MEKEVKDLMEQVTNEVKEMKEANRKLSEALLLKVSPEDIKTLKDAVKLADDAFEAKLVKIGEQLDKIQLDQKDNIRLGKGDDDFLKMKKNWDDKSFVERLKSKNGRFSETFEIKAVMDTNTYLSGSAMATAVVLPFREQGVGKAPDRIPMLLDLITKGNIGSDMDTWVERSARTMAAAAVAEGSAYASTFMTYIQRSQAVERLGHYVKVQNRSLEDWDLLMTEIQTELLTGLERVIEQDVYDGTGTTPEIQGITDTGHAAAYTSTALTGVKSANHMDAIRAAIMQLRLANFQATAGLINPADGAAMDLPKSGDGIYLLPPFVTADRTIVKGVPIYESNLVTAGDILLGDFRKDLLLFRKGIEIRIWEQNEDDVLYDRKTITASVRCCNRIKVPDYDAFVYDTIGDIITAIS